MNLQLGHYALDADPAATCAAYLPLDTAETGCSCQGCRNYAALVAKGLLPEPLRALLDTLGIDAAKPAEVFVYTRNPDGTLLYSGFYHLVGTLLEGETPWTPTTPDGTVLRWDEERVIPLADNLQVAFSPDILMLEESFPSPVVQLELEGSLPWVLDEACEYD